MKLLYDAYYNYLHLQAQYCIYENLILLFLLLNIMQLKLDNAVLYNSSLMIILKGYYNALSLNYTALFDILIFYWITIIMNLLIIEFYV